MPSTRRVLPWLAACAASLLLSCPPAAPVLDDGTAPAPESALKSLKVFMGDTELALEPAFSSDTFVYELEAPQGLAEVEVLAGLGSGARALSGTGPIAIDSEAGSGEYYHSIVVSGRAGSPLIYSIRFRFPPDPAPGRRLSRLLTSGILAPSFRPATTFYRYKVGYAYQGDTVFDFDAEMAGTAVEVLDFPRPLADGAVARILVGPADGERAEYRFILDMPSRVVVPPDYPPEPGWNLSLERWAEARQRPREYAQLKAFVEAAVEASTNGLPAPPRGEWEDLDSLAYGFSAQDAVALWRASRDDPEVDAAARESYKQVALAFVRKQVAEAHEEMEAGRRPPVTYDSYLEAGDMIADLAYTYSAFASELPWEEASTWLDYASATIRNIWNPENATWYRPSAPDASAFAVPWSGWGTDNPGNNYYYSFVKATMTYAFAFEDGATLDSLRSDILPDLVEYMAALPGGGSREGTGYGAAQHRLFETYAIWKDNLGFDLAAATSHARESIAYWVHATAPTLDLYAPIGDLSREAWPSLFSTQEVIVSQLVDLFPDSAEAAWGRWWLAENSVDRVQNYYLRPLLRPLGGPAAPPTERVYHALGAGHLFARSAWRRDAAWLSFVAGRYDESHAHQDQGSFQLYDGGAEGGEGAWLVVTRTVWGGGWGDGEHQDVVAHSGLRFEREGRALSQVPRSEGAASSMVYADEGGRIRVTARLDEAYADPSRGKDPVPRWERRLGFEEGLLLVEDDFETEPGVAAIFQLQVPARPSVREDGSIQAGGLRIVPLHHQRPVLRPYPYNAAAEEALSWIVELHDGPREGDAGHFRVRLEF